MHFETVCTFLRHTSGTVSIVGRVRVFVGVSCAAKFRRKSPSVFARLSKTAADFRGGAARSGCDSTSFVQSLSFRPVFFLHLLAQPGPFWLSPRHLRRSSRSTDCGGIAIVATDGRASFSFSAWHRSLLCVTHSLLTLSSFAKSSCGKFCCWFRRLLQWRTTLSWLVVTRELFAPNPHPVLRCGMSPAGPRIRVVCPSLT